MKNIKILMAAAFLFAMLLDAQAQDKKKLISLLLLVDVSGSMEGQKIETAKQSAKDMVDLYSRYNTEIAILAYDGPCNIPVSSQFNFSKDYQAAKNFISTLKADGRTPLCNAYKHAVNYMHNFRSKDSKQQLMLVLGDGGDDCHCLDKVLSNLKEEGKIYQTETIGLEVDATAEKQLKDIAKTTNGIYLSAETVFELPDKFAMLAVKPLMHEIVVKSRADSKNVFAKHSDALVKHKLLNATWILDSISLKMSPDFFFPIDISLGDIPHSFMFKDSRIDYFLYNKASWENGTYVLSGSDLTVDARIEAKGKSRYPFKVADISDKYMRLCLKEYEGEKYNCNSKINAGESSIMLYLKRVD